MDRTIPDTWSLEDAARWAGRRPDTLRRALARAAVTDTHGVTTARLGPLLGVRVGAHWRVLPPALERTSTHPE